MFFVNVIKAVSLGVQSSFSNARDEWTFLCTNVRRTGACEEFKLRSQQSAVRRSEFSMADRTMHNRWEQVFIHTAKCDMCEHHNKGILYRCLMCTFSICTPCKESDPVNGIHYMNDGGRGPTATPNAPMLLPTPQDTSSAHSIQPETAEPAKNERQRNIPRLSRKRRRSVIVEETDDDFGDEEAIPNGSRKGKKRQKTQRFETRTSATRRGIADTSPAVGPEKKRRTADFDMGESSRQANERTQPERVSRRAAKQASGIVRMYISMMANNSRIR